MGLKNSQLNTMLLKSQIADSIERSYPNISRFDRGVVKVSGHLSIDEVLEIYLTFKEFDKNNVILKKNSKSKY